jgi:NADPH:quinone reductase-like Zn-dependent oxidoreductase
MFVKQKFVTFAAKLSKEDLAFLWDLMKVGKVTPVTDRPYELGDTADAVRYLEEGHARGKVVVVLE